MAESPIIQLSPIGLIVTLERFCHEQYVDGKPTISLRTLEDMALSKRLPGAFRCPKSHIWMLNKLMLLQHGQSVEMNDGSVAPKEESAPITVRPIRPNGAVSRSSGEAMPRRLKHPGSSKDI